MPNNFVAMLSHVFDINLTAWAITLINMKYPATIRHQLEQAIASFRAGLFDDTSMLCQQILRRFPAHADALHLLGVALLSMGQTIQAVAQLRRASVIAPSSAEIHVNLGNALQQSGDQHGALASYELALQYQSDHAAAWNNRGHVLLTLQRPDEALNSFERALSIQPTHIRALNNLGTALIRLQRFTAALPVLQQALSHNPDYAEAHCNLGLAEFQLKHLEVALEHLNRALELKPQMIDALLGRADLHCDLRQHEQALLDYQQVLELEPSNPRALTNIGNAWLALGHAQEALNSYEAALRVEPENPTSLTNRGHALLKLGRFDAAIASFDAALVADPTFTNALNSRASFLHTVGRGEEALADFERLYALDPTFPYVAGNLLHQRQQVCDWQGIEELHQQVIDGVRAGHLSCTPFPFLAVCDAPELQLQCAQIYTQDQSPATPTVRPTPRASQRIRVAYVSGDLRQHAVSFLMAGVFRNHDRSRFEINAIALKPTDDSDYGRQLPQYFDRFLVASHLHDRQIAGLIRELDIDIAVDLMGHTMASRPGIFALRPAPLQIQHLGFPGSMGASFIDYLIADDFLIPETARQHYQEQLILMPHSFQSNDDQRAIASNTPTRHAAGLPEEGLVFCSFNNSYKLNPDCFALWMRLLQAVPNSVLWLVAHKESVAHNLRQSAQAHGVSAERLIFAKHLPYRHHLARLQLADLFLDSLPFNAGTTASDALWAGVPVLTCAGHCFAARMAGSLLRALDLPELITHSPTEYESRARQLAAHPEQLRQLRTRLAEHRLTKPLFNTRLHTQHLESAYESAWQRALRGEPPGTFQVPG